MDIWDFGANDDHAIQLVAVGTPDVTHADAFEIGASNTTAGLDWEDDIVGGGPDTEGRVFTKAALKFLLPGHFTWDEEYDLLLDDDEDGTIPNKHYTAIWRLRDETVTLMPSRANYPTLTGEGARQTYRLRTFGIAEVGDIYFTTFRMPSTYTIDRGKVRVIGLSREVRLEPTLRLEY